MDKQSFITKSVDSRKLPSKLPVSWNAQEQAEVRREIVEKLSRAGLDSFSDDQGVLEVAEGKNIEQAIGTVKVPVGMAGPLLIKNQELKGKKQDGHTFIPLATTEGALVASVNRGCKAIRLAGGVQVFAEDAGITRAPVFRLPSLAASHTFVAWILANKQTLATVGEKTSSHLALSTIEPKVVGRNVFLRMRFDTQEAMGMNMATIAAEAISRYIGKNSQAVCVSLSGNVCVDKKPSQLNVQTGRGKQVWAEVLLPKQILQDVLKTTADDLTEVGYRKVLLGSAVSGSMGFNAHYASVVAAIFLATGQDLGHVTEGSLGITTVEKLDDEVLVNVYLPDLVLGTVGGGTGLPTQQASLSIMDLGKGKTGEARQFARLVGGAVLAGEISLLSSLAEGSLAQAHQKLGRRGKR